MKFIKSLKKTAVLTAAVVIAGAVLLAPVVSAIPYDPNHPGTSTPQFNVFSGTPSVGNESDFFKGKVSTSTGYINDVTSDCANGTEFTLRAYVHNAANQAHNENGNGPSVAKNTKVKVALPGQAEASNFALNSTISSSNAGSVSDGMSINCNGKTVKLSYVAGSASQFTVPGGDKALSDSIVTTGAPIGTVAPNGDVWGCWDQRVWVTLKVKVNNVPDKPKPSLGECKVVDLKTEANRKVTVKVNGETNNAQIVGYRINFGDGTISEKQSDSHQYAKDGTYVITGEVRVKYVDGTEEWKTADNCKKQVTFEGDKPPKVVPPTPSGGPTVLPETGPAGVAAIVTAVTGMSTAAYYWVVRRRSEV